MGDEPTEDAYADFSELISRLGHNEEYFSFAAELVDGVIEKIEVLDSIIRELVDNWEFSRIAKADLALLRVSLRAQVPFGHSSCRYH